MAVLRFLFALSFLLSTSALTQATDVHYCDKKGDYDVKVSGVEISPYPIVKGKPATFSISASAGKAVSGGKLVIDVSYFGFHIYSETDDICGKTSCPISSGDFIISHSQVLPGFTPPGTYTLKMTMLEDGSNDQLTCITFDFSIGFFPFEAIAYN
ncbi:hypothetical protein RHSIM_Rhsim01G0068700 [Rhododendron simsii]|uniref:MD-2-related lipid-recognition domain-containing protein n=1 Tax=Rhododendron simsii TaxID=118357 RepID=A0A834HKB6_RHOSS|nr:hypothetical protein RHSIM_Rhsim01G0068700 [Rhododendron simsii]